MRCVAKAAFAQVSKSSCKKKIPAGRGLGGGSSDAAAALIGYLQLTRQKLETPRLLDIAAGLGADVPFFLFGGTALGIGKGEEIYPLPDPPHRTLLIVSPADVHVPTPDAYRWLHAPELASLTKSAANHKLFRFCALCWSAQEASLSNDFEAAVFRRHPRLAKSSGICFIEELQKPCWRVAVRRCLVFSRTQRRRAELLSGFRTISPSSAKRFRGKGMRM